jgi:hypothetical protein
MAYQNPNPHPLESGVSSSSIRAQATLDWFIAVREAIAELQQFFNTVIGGGIDGIIAFGDDVDASYRTSATSPVSMRVTIEAGWAFVDGVPFRMIGDYTTPNFVAPVTDDRIDTLAASAITRSITIYTGNESSSPVAPAVTGEGEIEIAQIYHRPGETSIKNSDDSTNGYISDTRVWGNR